MGDASISRVKAMGPAGKEAADVVSPGRPGGGPAPPPVGGGCLRAHSQAPEQARSKPLLVARSWRGKKPCRAQVQSPRGEVKREKAPHSPIPERGKPRPSTGSRGGRAVPGRGQVRTVPPPPPQGRVMANAWRQRQHTTTVPPAARRGL